MTPAKWYRPLLSQGFAEVPQDATQPRLAALRTHEAGLGLDIANRCAMRLAV